MSKTIDLDAAIAAIMIEPSEVRHPAYYAEKLKRLSAVPQEMSAREFFPKWFEICNTYLPDDCYHCPLYLRANHRKFTPPCMYLMMTDSEEAAAIVEKWAREHPEGKTDHPEPKRKTYAEDFKEHFGHSWNNKDNNWQCRRELYNDIADCVNSPLFDCEACWNEEMEAKDE